MAGQFLEVLRVFGDAGEEVEERIRYAKWKASDILKALNEGMVPHPGPPGSPPLEEGGDVESAPESQGGDRKDYEHSQGGERRASEHSQGGDRRASEHANLPSFTGTFNPPASQSPPTSQSPPVQRYSPPAPPPTPQYQQSPQQNQQHQQQQQQIDPLVLSEAEKHSRYAISALQFEDTATAIKQLEQALAILRR